MSLQEYFNYNINLSTSANLIINSTNSNINATTLTVANSLITNSSISNLIVISGLNSIFNSNTIGGAIFTTGGNVGIRSTSPNISSLLTIMGGTSTVHTTQSNIAFGIGSQPGFYHFINSRHNGQVSSNQNAIDFYLNNSTTPAGSSSANFGNVNSMSVTATGVGIFTSNPSYTLDVNGIGRFSNGIGLGYGDTLGLNVFGLINTRLIDVTFQNAYDTTQIYTPGNNSSTPKISIQHNGNVGINNTNPSLNGINLPTGGAGIHWSAGVNIGVSRIYDDGDLRICTDDNMRFYTGSNSTTPGTERMTLTPSTLDVNCSIKGLSYNGVTTSFSGVTTVDITFDVTNYRKVEVDVAIEFSTSGGQLYINTTSNTELGEDYTCIVIYSSAGTRNIYTDGRLFEAKENNSQNGGTFTTTIYKPSTTNGRTNLITRGAYCWSGSGLASVEHYGQFSGSLPTQFRLRSNNGNMAGSYTIRNYN